MSTGDNVSELVNDSNYQTDADVQNTLNLQFGNVDNTSDLNKPISTATQAALDNKYDSSNPSGFENSC